MRNVHIQKNTNNNVKCLFSNLVIGFWHFGTLIKQMSYNGVDCMHRFDDKLVNMLEFEFDIIVGNGLLKWL